MNLIKSFLPIFNYKPSVGVIRRYCKKMAYNNYEITRIPGVTKENEEGINRMVDIYIAHDPVVSAFKIHQGRQISQALRNYLLKPIDQGLSFVAVDKESEQIIGLVINHIDKPECQMDALERDVKDEHEKELVNFWLSLGSEPKTLQNEFIFNIEFNIVDPNFRKSGIGLQLGDKSIHLAHSMNQKYVRSECTNAFTAVIAEKLSYTREYSIAYSDVVDSKGNRIFEKIVEPHTHFHVYVLYLEQFKGKPYVPAYELLKKNNK